MQRVVIPELLDTDAGTPREVEDSLADLRMINRYFGGLKTMVELVREIATQRQIMQISLLDVGGATGDLAAMTSQSLSQDGIELQPVVLDRMPRHMTSSATKFPAAVNGHYRAIAGDALALPFEDNSFDIVGCSLFVHHLEPPQIIQFVSQALRVARHAVLINDLIRHPLHVLLVYMGFPLYRSRITRHDSVASVRRAYTVSEIERLLQQTDSVCIKTRRFFPFRMGVIAWKQKSST